MITSGIVGKGDLEVCGPVVKNPPANAGDSSSIPGSGRSPGEGVLLPGKYHGQRGLAGYSPWGRYRVGHDLATKQ